MRINYIFKQIINGLRIIFLLVKKSLTFKKTKTTISLCQQQPKKKNQSINQAPIRIWLYSSNSWHSLESYAIFFSDFDGLCTIVMMKMKNKNDVLGFLRLKYKTY